MTATTFSTWVLFKTGLTQITLNLQFPAVSQPPYHSYHTFSTTVSNRLSIIKIVVTEPSVFPIWQIASIPLHSLYTKASIPLPTTTHTHNVNSSLRQPQQAQYWAFSVCCLHHEISWIYWLGGGTALAQVCILMYVRTYVLVASLRPYTVNFQMSAFKYITNTWIFLPLIVKTRILQERSITIKEILSEDDLS